MGLDGVELIMEIEDEFGITISAFDGPEMRTVADLVAQCLERIHATETTRCHSLPCFLSLRQLVRDVVSDQRFKVRPRDKVENRLNDTERKRLWRRLPELLKTLPPELRRPSWLRKTLVISVLAFPIILMAVFPWHEKNLVLILLASLAFPVILHLTTTGLRTRTPAGYSSFGDITKRIVGLRVATKPPARTDYETVFSIVKNIIVEQLGVQPADVVPAARFVEDLGVG